jgi:hypothetical protein
MKQNLTYSKMNADIWLDEVKLDSLKNSCKDCTNVHTLHKIHFKNKQYRLHITLPLKFHPFQFFSENFFGKKKKNVSKFQTIIFLLNIIERECAAENLPILLHEMSWKSYSIKLNITKIWKTIELFELFL